MWKAVLGYEGNAGHRMTPCPPVPRSFLVDRGDLMLFMEVQGQQRLLSVQEGYELMVSPAA